MTAEQALLEIQELLDGVEWTPETLDKIAGIVVSAGYRVRDLDDRDTPEPLDQKPIANARRYADALDEMEIPPNGDDFNAVMAMLEGAPYTRPRSSGR